MDFRNQVLQLELQAEGLMSEVEALRQQAGDEMTPKLADRLLVLEAGITFIRAQLEYMKKYRETQD